MVDVHYITDRRCYSFESDNENNINGYELSDLSDVFEDDSIDIKKAVQNQLQSLTLDDIPYDRDVNYINIPSSTRQKSLLRNVPNRLFQQVRTITEGNVEEIEKLDRHYAALDQTKREYDRRSLFVDKKEKDDGGFRGGNTKKKRSRKPKNDNKESLPEEDPIVVDKMNDYEYDRASHNQRERGGLHRGKTRELKKQTSTAHHGDDSQKFVKMKATGRIQSDGAMNDSTHSSGGPARQNQQKAVHPHYADLYEEDSALQAQGYPTAQGDYEEYDVDDNDDQPGYNSKPVSFRAIPSDREKDRNSFRFPQPRDNHSDMQRVSSDSHLYSHPPDEEGTAYYSGEPLSRSIVSTKEYSALGFDSHAAAPAYHKSSSRPGNYSEFKAGNGRRLPPQSDATPFSASTSKHPHRSHYKSSTPDPAPSLQHPQYAQQYGIPSNNKSSYKAGQQQRYDGKKLHGRHGYANAEPLDLQGNHYDDDGTELSMGLDAGGYGHSPQHYDMDARAGRHFSQQVAEVEVPPPQQRRQPYPHASNGSDYRPPRAFQGASSAMVAPPTAKQQQPPQPQPLRPPAARFAPTPQAAAAGESPPFQGSDPNANSNPSNANEFKLNPSAAEWVPFPKFRPR